jgi:hypothetical protein
MFSQGFSLNSPRPGGKPGQDDSTSCSPPSSMILCPRKIDFLLNTGRKVCFDIMANRQVILSIGQVTREFAVETCNSLDLELKIETRRVLGKGWDILKRSP